MQIRCYISQYRGPYRTSPFFSIEIVISNTCYKFRLVEFFSITTDFYCKNPSWVNPQNSQLGFPKQKFELFICLLNNSDFTAKIRVVKFCNQQLGFLSQISELLNFVINDSYFYRKNLTKFNNSDFCVRNPSCVFFRFNNSGFCDKNPSC